MRESREGRRKTRASTFVREQVRGLARYGGRAVMVVQGGVYLQGPLQRLVVLSRSIGGERKRIPVGESVRGERIAG